jgi:hypothetical protein
LGFYSGRGALPREGVCKRPVERESTAVERVRGLAHLVVCSMSHAMLDTPEE